ncbi:MAG: DUF4145 domain-containing protein, partial [Lysobacterales bacterium]
MTTSNFSFLQTEWPALHAEALKAQQAVWVDPRTACFYARRTLELAVTWLFRAETGSPGSLKMPYKSDLSAYLFEPSFKVLVGPALHAKMDLIRKQGNNAVHSARPVVAQDALAVLRELFQVTFWLARHYGRNVALRPDVALQFRPDLLPKAQTTGGTVGQAQSQDALKKLADDLT